MIRVFPNKHDLQDMIAQAMEAKAPALYRRLQKNGTLVEVVVERADAALQSYQDATNLMPAAEQTRIQNLPYLEGVQALQQRSKAATEVAIAQAIEFPREGEPNSPKSSAWSHRTEQR